MLGSSPTQYDSELSSNLNKQYPNAVDGDAVVFFGPTDAPELMVKYSGYWQRGWPPGSPPGMTMEARPDYKRIIDDQTKRGDPRLSDLRDTQENFGFHYAIGSFDQEVIADKTGKIVAGDPGQISVKEWLSMNRGALVTPDVRTPPFVNTLSPNYAAYAALAVVAFLALRGLK
jgi:hypothetical protein